jgi:hypothetical protein
MEKGHNGAAFDQLARLLAGELPRREALRRIGGGLAGAVLASLGLGKVWGQAPSECEGYCRARIDPRRSRGAFGSCVSSCQDCLRHGGALCGASSTGGGIICCPSGQTCQGGHCLAGCSPPCTGGKVCVNGNCECPMTLAACGDVCVDTATDPTNCRRGKWWRRRIGETPEKACGWGRLAGSTRPREMLMAPARCPGCVLLLPRVLAVKLRGTEWIGGDFVWRLRQVH